jgi:CubicO group peptidase (beta-lactamase class C family)
MLVTARAILFAASLAALIPIAHAQPTLPATPQGEVAQALLDALNSPDPSDIQRVDPRAAGIRLESGGFDIISVEPSGADQIVLVLRDRMFGNYQQTTFMFAPGEARIVGLRASSAPGAPAIERVDDAALAAFVTDAIEKVDYSGALIVARDGKPFISVAAGLTDREADLPNTLDTRFRVGSMNKMMTATAIMQLVQTGKVQLEAPVGTYLKDYPNKEFAATVTIHHLLSHTGGAGDIFGPQFDAKRLELKSLKDYVALYGSRAPEFPPGEDWRYANYGFILLGRVIEEVSGQSYPDYVSDHIFKTAGMTRSGFEPESVAVEDRSKGYMTGAADLESNMDTLPWSGTSAGGGYSTVVDWLAFARALTGHKLLDKAHTDLLMSHKTSTGYAYGFNDSSTADIPAAGHSGGAPGMNGDLRIIGEGQIVIVALSNISPPGRASQLANEITKRVTVVKPDGSGAQAVWMPAVPPTATEEQRVAAFKAADVDGDGKLDRAAFRKALDRLGFADRLEPVFRQRDIDKDGFITEEEARATLP